MAVVFLVLSVVALFWFVAKGKSKDTGGKVNNIQSQPEVLSPEKNISTGTDSKAQIAKDDVFKDVLADDVPRTYGMYFLVPTTPNITKAVINGELDKVRKYLEDGVDPDVVDSNSKTSKKETPFMFAMALERIEIGELLLSKGANIEARDTNGNTALLIAVMNNKIKSVNFLIQNKADVNATSNTGYTPLIFATHKDSEFVRMLLEAGAKTDAKTKSFGVSALIDAVQDGSYESVKLLLEHGANVNEQSKSGYTSLDYILSAKKPDDQKK